jgi:hypothetical protein
MNELTLSAWQNFVNVTFDVQKEGGESRGNKLRPISFAFPQEIWDK